MFGRIIATAAAVFLAYGASAATITNLGDASSVNSATGTAISGASLSGGFSIDSTSVSGVTRSVYEGTGAYGDDYFSVGAGQSATLTLDPGFGTGASLSFLLGSPDSYNHISFYLDGVNVFGFDGTDVPGGYTAGLGAVYLSVSGLEFDTVVFASDRPALEFANIFVTGTDETMSRALSADGAIPAVPLPATGLLLLGAVAALGPVRRRRS